ncbi:unnamed protein product [Ilex paraguariensis]|uniref:Protein kinase domain-containing protein n=1 Tax=Ilex paraguariensis TaxID=185542 RepID=A0ABC8QQ86_9AQUA
MLGSMFQAAVAAAASFFLVGLMLAVILILCKSTKKRRRSQPQPRTRTQDLAVPNSDHSSITIGESALFDPLLNRVSMQELLQVTRNFHPELIIGDGSFGIVYKAKLSAGVTVAVKKLAADAFQGFREFRAEMETLGKIRHKNIVQILGYCATGSDRVLIYEFIERGSLDQWLYDTSSSWESSETEMSSSSQRLPLSWGARINIVRGIATALCYMHNLETPIIHRDIKSSNVLLDSNFEAHVADFGLARMIEGAHSHVSTQVAGTMGYMPPEYFSGATMASVMGDVYSFGILMLEIATARRPNLPFMGEEGKEIRLIDWLRKMVEQNRHLEMVDANILRDELKEDMVVEFFRIAKMCSDEVCKFRPGMQEVIELLDKINVQSPCWIWCMIELFYNDGITVCAAGDCQREASFGGTA